MKSVEYYKDAASVWRWRERDSDGDVLRTSSGPFPSKGHAMMDYLKSLKGEPNG